MEPQWRKPRPDLGCSAIGWMDGWMDLMKTHGRYQDTILGMTHSSAARIAYSSQTAEASYQFKRDPITHTHSTFPVSSDFIPLPLYLTGLDFNISLF
jgi:hypothetical protein